MYLIFETIYLQHKTGYKAHKIFGMSNWGIKNRLIQYITPVYAILFLRQLMLYLLYFPITVQSSLFGYNAKRGILLYKLIICKIDPGSSTE